VLQRACGQRCFFFAFGLAAALRVERDAVLERLEAEARDRELTAFDFRTEVVRSEAVRVDAALARPRRADTARVLAFAFDVLRQAEVRRDLAFPADLRDSARPRLTVQPVDR